MPRTGGKRRKTRTHKEVQDEEFDFIPKSFILKRGRVGPLVKELVQDVRNLMYPNTALKLQES